MDREQSMVRSIAQFTSTRDQLLFARELATRNMPLFGGLTADRYLSTHDENVVSPMIRARLRLPIVSLKR